MNRQFIDYAIDIAVKNVEFDNGGPFGAIIVKENEIISESGNQVTQLLDPTAHAEILCIRDACRKLKSFQLTGCILYTSCEPCPMCLGAIYWARLDKVYFCAKRTDAQRFGFDDLFIYHEIKRLPEERNIPMLHSNVENALEPFYFWQKKINKILY
ncbi:MAG: nucleoside deaminase [Methylococcaceae bacterium]|nr:nucleoside deaminase [Methylococcaceae bacterium]